MYTAEPHGTNFRMIESTSRKWIIGEPSYKAVPMSH